MTLESLVEITATSTAVLCRRHPPTILLLTSTTKSWLGAVGVSGAAGDTDEYCTLQAVREVKNPGLTTLPQTNSCSTVQD